MRSFSTTSGTQVKEYLYSQVGHAVRSATIASGTVTQDADGDRILNKGVVLAKITSGADSGKYGPYDTGASDGRQTDSNIRGVNDTYRNAKDGDVEVGMTYTGQLREDIVTVKEAGTEATVKAASTKATIKAAMANAAYEMDIVFVDPTA